MELPSRVCRCFGETQKLREVLARPDQVGCDDQHLFCLIVATSLEGTPLHTAVLLPCEDWLADRVHRALHEISSMSRLHYKQPSKYTDHNMLTINMLRVQSGIAHLDPAWFSYTCMAHSITLCRQCSWTGDHGTQPPSSSAALLWERDPAAVELIAIHSVDIRVQEVIRRCPYWSQVSS